jgi:hypothetical protein
MTVFGSEADRYTVGRFIWQVFGSEADRYTPGRFIWHDVGCPAM